MVRIQTNLVLEDRLIRMVWSDEQEKWFFCVADIVEALTDSKDPKDYIKKLRKRDLVLSKGWEQLVTPFPVWTTQGVQRVNCTTREGMLRIIQAIPTAKAELYKRWMAQLGSQRIQQIQPLMKEPDYVSLTDIIKSDL